MICLNGGDAMRLKNNVDLTKGTIWKTLLFFAIPILIGGFFQQLYTVVDAIIVGRYVGTDGLAAVDSVMSMLSLPVNFFIGLATGATIIVSQLFGARNYKSLKRTLHTSMFFAFTGGLFLSVLGVVFAPFFVSFMSVPSDIMGMTNVYVRIFFSGFMAFMVYNIGAGILRALGDSRYPLYILMVACLVNIVFDLVFVARFSMGVAGAGLATLIAQFVCSFMVLFKLKRLNPSYALVFRDIKLDRGIFSKILKIGLPVGLQSAIYPLSNLLIASQINKNGTSSIAAWALTGKMDITIWLFVDSLAAATATFVAQNYGAGKKDRVRKVIGVSMFMILAIDIFLSSMIYFYGPKIGLIFVPDASREIIEILTMIVGIMGPFYFTYAFGEVLSCVLRGMGVTFVPMAITLFGTCLMRVFWIFFVLPLRRELSTVLFVYPVTWILTSVIMVLYFLYYRSHNRDKFSLD